MPASAELKRDSAKLKLFGGMMGSLADAFERGQAGEELFAVAGGEDAVVEDGNAAVVVFGADEAADGLHEFDAGFGHGDFHKGVAAALFYPAAAGFFDGVVGHGEGQLGDDDLHAVAAGQVEPFSEAVEPKENAGAPAGDGLAVAFEQNGFGQVTLDEQEGQVAFR